MLLSWRLSLIFLYVVACMWNKPVDNTSPSRNLQRVLLLASALSASCFHVTPFPFTLAEFWTTCPVLTTEAHTRSISFFASGWSTINFSYLSSNEASMAHQRASYCVSVAEPSLAIYTLRHSPTWCLLCNEFYFGVVLMIHTNYSCYRTITYLQIYAVSTHSWLTHSTQSQFSILSYFFLLKLHSINELSPNTFSTQCLVVQSSKLLLSLPSTVILGFGPRQCPWPYFCSFQTLRVLKWDLLFKDRLHRVAIK
jgi:hypothetical protein